MDKRKEIPSEPTILTRMKKLAKSLPEYSTVRSMSSVGKVFVPKLIAKMVTIVTILFLKFYWHIPTSHVKITEKHFISII